MAAEADVLPAGGDTLGALAAVCDRVAGEGSKLAKAGLVAAYLAGLAKADDDLRAGVTFLSGRTFPAGDERVTGVSSAGFRAVVLELTGIDAQTLRETFIREGDAGEALAAVWERTGGWATDGSRMGGSGMGGRLPLRLGDLTQAFSRMAMLSEAAGKRAELKKALSRCCTAREACYLAKILFGDLRTGVQDGVLLDAIGRAFDAEPARLRQALLLEGDLGAVASLAARGRLGEARFHLFRPVAFMLAAAVESPEAAAEQIGERAFVMEDKLDGIRVQVHVAAGRADLFTRTLDSVRESFPEVAEAFAGYGGELLLDGEVVPWDESAGEGAGAVAAFGRLQKRLGRKRVTPAMRAETPVRFIAFDLLYADGELLLDQPLSARRARLEEVAKGLGLLTLPQTVVRGTEAAGQIPAGQSRAGQIAAGFEAARGRRNEGILLKDTASVYSPGRRGQFWFKLKSHLPTLDCVVTAAEHGHGKRRAVLSDYTFAVWETTPGGPGGLVNIGKAFSGVTDEEIEKLTAIFRDISETFDGRVHRVRPQVVLEVAFDAVQQSGRHASGFALRFPRIKRVRWDKAPQDADTLARVREIYASPQNLNRTDAPDSTVAEARPSREPTLFDGL